MFPESIRLQRNQAEKHRRDKLNGYVTQLTTLVPLVAKAGRRVDKTSVLRLSAAYLRLHRYFPDKLSYTKSMNSDELQTVMKSFNGFFLLVDINNKILFSSLSVEKYLGFQNIDLIGHSVFHFVHSDDEEFLQKHIKNCFSRDPDLSDKFTFHCRIRDQDQSKTENHQLMIIKGQLISNFSKEMIILIIQPIPFCPKLSLQDGSQDEYITRHGLDGTIIFADQRISLITGHFPSEVSGLSAFRFILESDVPIASFAHKLMFTSTEGTGVIVYRLQTRNGKSVYLQSHGHIQKNGNEIDHFVCVNRLLSGETGKKVMKSFTKRFWPFLEENAVLQQPPQIMSSDVDSSSSPISVLSNLDSFFPSTSTTAVETTLPDLEVSQPNINFESIESWKDISLVPSPPVINFETEIADTHIPFTPSSNCSTGGFSMEGSDFNSSDNLMEDENCALNDTFTRQQSLSNTSWQFDAMPTQKMVSDDETDIYIPKNSKSMSWILDVPSGIPSFTDFQLTE